MPASVSTRESSKILAADDDRSMVRFLELLLSREGYAVVTAFDGEEALLKARTESPDLVLLDVVMPKMDGVEVCRRVKENPRTRLIPIVMITNLTGLDDKLKAINAGADDLLHKPYERMELLARVRSLLRVKHLSDELALYEETAQRTPALSPRRRITSHELTRGTTRGEKPTPVREPPLGLRTKVLRARSSFAAR